MSGVPEALGAYFEREASVDALDVDAEVARGAELRRAAADLVWSSFDRVLGVAPIDREAFIAAATEHADTLRHVAALLDRAADRLRVADSIGR